MSDIALRVDGVGKRYRIGTKASATGGMYHYKSLRDALGNISRRPLQTLRSAFVREPMDEDNSFWALRDVGFEVKRGEVVGIIGRNGAGKSTLLKVLSRITKPTTGRVDLYGRVGSLLEVGTGFHPELTGRENVFLNGAILGMTRAEVRSRFDEIVDFSEIERFLDTPVKQYSSGMYTRLAFAVAAHLEPEILMVDEVLAVGDAAFQKKCLGKMKTVADQGRTVLFVSHNLGVMTTLCDTGVLLTGGRVTRVGPIREVASTYLKQTVNAAENTARVVRGPTSMSVTVVNLADDKPTTDILFTQPAALAVTVETDRPIKRANVVLTLAGPGGDLVGYACMIEEGLEPFPIDGACHFRYPLRPAVLIPGTYSVSARIYDESTASLVFQAENSWSFDIVPAPLGQASRTYGPVHGTARVIDGVRVVSAVERAPSAA